MTHGYKKLPLMLLVHFVVMYAVMYAMVARGGDVFNNLGNAYMAGMMVTPMLPLMLLLMPSMYPDRRLNIILWAGSIVVFALLFGAMRGQWLVGDRQFLRSMIPHHSGAILMCGESSLSDPEIKNLCSEIIKAQEEEISQMKGILERLDR